MDTVHHDVQFVWVKSVFESHRWLIIARVLDRFLLDHTLASSYKSPWSSWQGLLLVHTTTWEWLLRYLHLLQIITIVSTDWAVFFTKFCDFWTLADHGRQVLRLQWLSFIWIWHTVCWWFLYNWCTSFLVSDVPPDLLDDTLLWLPFLYDWLALWWACLLYLVCHLVDLSLDRLCSHLDGLGRVDCQLKSGILGIICNILHYSLGLSTTVVVFIIRESVAVKIIDRFSL